MPSNSPEYSKKYYAVHKTHIKHMMTERILCECCKRTYDKSNFPLHTRSNKHKLNAIIFRNLNKIDI